MAQKSTGAFLRVGRGPKNGGVQAQEKEKKKRKNIEFNYSVFKSEYSIQSLLLVCLVCFWVVVWLESGQVGGGWVMIFAAALSFWDDALGSDLFLPLMRLDSLCCIWALQGRQWDFEGLWLVSLEPSHWCTRLSGCTGLGESNWPGGNALWLVLTQNSTHSVLVWRLGVVLIDVDLLPMAKPFSN